ncbi:hypothetical protein [Flavivirga eckloniae]|uniref:Uncharacterized protein n=1 Tax=Flavivirga eckloniae TaxID=1803846 RepID=A0A2K9PM64_9FLAO|nr:hypothetical protein [Flavivirga eckloniae]AUP77667.1 hypothetical protein C1H87_02625 [Flavivirga eckloniae]
MGLDLTPLPKPKLGYEDRFKEIFNILKDMQDEDYSKSPSIIELFIKKKYRLQRKLLREWHQNSISSFDTIKAPRVGYDDEADNWFLKSNKTDNEKLSDKTLIKKNKGFYVIELAKEIEGVPIGKYCARAGYRNGFRGEYLRNCEDLIGDLVYGIYGSSLAEGTLEYGYKLINKADEIAKKHDLIYLKKQREAPDEWSGHIKSRLHLIYSLANWLIFYGKNGHGYEADF